VAVTAVQEHSPAWGVGLRPGDLVLGVNRERVEDLDDFRRKVRESRQVLALNLQRGSASVFIVIR
jgi:serine protease DegQ